MAASEHVFATVELLETVLLKLPIRDLLLVQRTNKQWQAVITGSKKVQRALFFEPVTSSPISLLLSKPPSSPAEVRVYDGQS